MHQKLNMTSSHWNKLRLI